MVLDFLAVDNFDFARKIVKKNCVKNSWNCWEIVKIEFLDKNLTFRKVCLGDLWKDLTMLKQLFWIFTGHYFLNNALVIDDLLCSEQRWKKRANHVCQKWDSFRALLLLEKKWILNGMMASSSVVHSKVRKYCYLKWSCKRLKNRSLESNFGQKNLHFNCWLSSKHQQRRCFKC